MIINRVVCVIATIACIHEDTAVVIRVFPFIVLTTIIISKAAIAIGTCVIVLASQVVVVITSIDILTKVAHMIM